MCKKTRRLRGKLAEICRHDSALLKEIIINGINLGFRECEFQFRNRRWNCTVLRKSMRKILMRGKYFSQSKETSFGAGGIYYSLLCIANGQWAVNTRGESTPVGKPGGVAIAG